MVELAPRNPYGLSLRTPVLAAAGCLGYGVEYLKLIDLGQLGAIVTRSTSLHGRRRALPRLIETPGGLLGAGDWPDPGLSYVIGQCAPAWAGWPTPVILSIVGGRASEYAAIAAALEGVEGIAGLELNLAQQAEQAASITAAVRAATQLPLLAKLPYSTAIGALALAVAGAGADALTVAAPPPGGAPDPQSGELVDGWLAGPAIRPLALAAVRAAAHAAGCPIVGCGGVSTLADAQALLAAGAIAVQVGSALLTNPVCAGAIGAALANPPTATQPNPA